MKTSDELALELEKKIKVLEYKVYDAFDSNGNINLKSVLNYLIKGNSRAKKKYMALVAEYNRVRNHPQFAKKFNSIVRPGTLKKIRFYGSYIVRPLKNNGCSNNKALFFGQVIKLPTEKPVDQLEDSEAWKRLIKKDREIEVGNKVIYTFKTDIILDNETLHLVGYFEGKVLDETLLDE